MELRHLRYFCAVAETLNLSKTSQAIHVTQPALSRQIRDLEEELGVALFIRHHTGVRLTPSGRKFHQSAQKILSFAETAVQEVSESSKPESPMFTVGVDRSSVSPWFFRTLRDFAADHKQTPLAVSEGGVQRVIEGLRTGKLDIGLTGSDVDMLPVDVEAMKIRENPVTVLLSTQHRYAEQSKIDLSQLSEEALVVYEDDPFLGRRGLAMRACHRAGFEPTSILRADSYTSMLSFVVANRGFALDTGSANLWLYKDVLREIPLSRPRVSLVINAIWHRNTISEMRNAFLEFAMSERTE